MHITIRKLLCFSLALVFSTTTIIAKAQRSVPTAPPPPQIAAAHKVFISNGGGPGIFHAYTGGTDRLYNSFYSAIDQWNHYQIVASPSDADIILEISGHSLPTPYGRYNDPVYQPQLVLRVIDSKTNAVLWTMNANIQSGVFQSTRNKHFDQAVHVIVDQLRQLTGEQLNPAEIKTIRSDNRWPTSSKILLGVAIGAAIGLTAFGVHRITHPSTPTLPTVPASSF